MALDAAGNLYISDTNNNRIRRVTPAGVITTFAGTGVKGYSGDGGPAGSAQIAEPEGLAADAAGNIYIADQRNNRIRRVVPGGTINTLAGGTVRDLGDGGPAVNAKLVFPTGIAVDTAGNFYIAEHRGNRVRKVSSAGTISTLAGAGPNGFAGDGGLAGSALLSDPFGVAVDSAGAVYIADTSNHRIRKVSSAGIITTVAGNGQAGLSGDGGPALSASLNGPRGVAVDASGSLYIADSNNGRIRKVSAAGTISTIAGGGTTFGDNGPATKAQLFLPIGIALDGAGNIFIADFLVSRVRRVGLDGNILTIAGISNSGFSGDGGLSFNAALNLPSGVAIDAAGQHLYIADAYNERVRTVDATITINTVAGNGDTKLSGDGGLAVNASLSLPFGVALDAAGNIYIADAGHYSIRKVLATAPSLSLAPASLTMSLQSASSSGITQNVTVSSSLTGLQWNVQTSTDTGGNWLQGSPAVGSAPGILSVTANSANLLPGSYHGKVTVSASGATPSSLAVGVDLTVQPGLVPQVLVEPFSMNIESKLGAGNPPAQTLRIGNAGPGSLPWAVRLETANGGNWLSVSLASGTTSAGTPSEINVSANVSGLAPAVYSGVLHVTSPANTQELVVPVTLVLNAPSQVLRASHGGLLFTGVERAGATAPQSVAILNTGSGIMNWTADASTLSGGNWLTITPGSGKSDAAAPQSDSLTVGVNVSGVPAGQYAGLIRLMADGAANSPQFVSVQLNVLPVGSDPGGQVRATGLIYAARAAGSSPSSQTVRVSVIAPGSKEVRAFANTFDRGNWLDILPNDIVLTADQPGFIKVQPAVGKLARGTYRGAVTLLFSDGSPTQVVDVLFQVAPGQTAFTDPGGRNFPESFDTGPVCEPKQLLAVQSALGSNFASPVGWPTTIEVHVLDDCANPVTDATAIVSFSNGDPPLALVSLQNGTYVGAWRPLNSTSQLTVKTRVSRPPLTEVVVQSAGQVSANSTASVINSGGVVSASSYMSGQALAPGSIVSVFGVNLARQPSQASQVPLLTQMGGATLTIGGIAAPLYVTTNNQVNAQIPFEMLPSSRPQAYLKVDTDSGSPNVTVPETITISAAQPGIFSTNQRGTGQGVITSASGQIVDSSAPAQGGDIVVIYCNGLGVTTPPVASGAVAPGQEPLARVAAVTAAVGGVPATVVFAGLVPNLVGLYQVNVQIPAGLSTGNVPVVLTVNGINSNSVTLAAK